MVREGLGHLVGRGTYGLGVVSPEHEAAQVLLEASWLGLGLGSGSGLGLGLGLGLG